MRSRLATALFSLLLLTAPYSTAQSQGSAGRSEPGILERLSASSLQGVIPYNVHLTGGLPVSGKFMVPPGTRVDDLLFLFAMPMSKSAVMSSDAYDLRRVLVTRPSGERLTADLIAYNMGGLLQENPLLTDGDVVTVHRRSKDQPGISISGAVLNPLFITFREGDTLEKLLAMAGGRSAEADGSRFLVLRQTNGPEGAARIEVPSGEAAGFAPRPDDAVIVPFAGDRRPVRRVFISGEVTTPGYYPIREDRTTLAEVIQMAGGPTDEARLQSVKVLRTRPSAPSKTDTDPLASFGALALEPPDAASQTQDAVLNGRSGAAGSVPPTPSELRLSDQYRENTELFRGELQMDSDLIHVDLRDGVAAAGLTLMDGDRIVVDRDEGTVRLMGQISTNGFVPHVEGMDALGYIAKAGGFGPAADSSRIYIIKAGRSAWLRPGETAIESGDIVFVDRTPLVAFAEDRAADLTEASLRIQESSLKLQESSLELQESSLRLQERSNRRTTIVSLFGTAMSVVTTYLLIRNY